MPLGRLAATSRSSFCLLLLGCRGILLDGVGAFFATEVEPMTVLLEQALAKVQTLPQPEQDAIASLILDELADEQRWTDSFARSQDQLAKLAAKAREDIRASRVHGASIKWQWAICR